MTPDESAPHAESAEPLDEYDTTDLELAMSQLDHPTMQYEWASLLSDFLGPARAATQLSEDDWQRISMGVVQLDRRRVTAQGEVRVRMSVAGVRVDRCGICLQQFRPCDQACILPCMHMYVGN